MTQEINSTQISDLLVRDLLKERRADRFWKNIRFIAWFIFWICVFLSVINAFSDKSTLKAATRNKHLALLRLNGTIAPESNFSSEQIVPLLTAAFKDKTAIGVVIDINSPGGTPVQASIIHDAIIALKKKYHKKVIVVGEDLLTSGAYYVAVAADKIYVNPNTLTGSIGVIMKGFGLVDLIKKLGIERRVYIAGNNKDRLDPFLPQNPEDVKKIQEVINEVHQNFVQAVIEGRKGKLVGDPMALFTGDFWSGEAAFKLGLVDGLGNLNSVMEQEFGTTEVKDYSESSNFFRMLGGQFSSALDSMVYLYS